MFYSVDLLSLRRKGRLARCWLAATVSEKMFKKTCKASLIKQIDVSCVCEEIVSMLEIRRNESYRRFSLYLSSQLMYGVTKVLHYQTVYFQDYLFQLNKKLERHVNVESGRDKFDAAAAFELPKVTPISQTIAYNEMPSNLHTINEDIYIEGVEYMMQDEMNFGLLTNFDMEQLMLDEPEELSLNHVRKFHCNQSENIPGESIEVPVVDRQFELGTNDFEKRSSQTYEREFTVNVKDDHLEKSIPITPKKRNLKPPTDSPSKKRKTIPEEVSEQPIAHEEPTVPPPIGEPVAPESETLQYLPTEIEEVINVPKQKRRRRLHDKYTQLSDAIMRTNIENVTAHTREHQDRPNSLLADTYLTKPSVQISNKSYGRTLMKFYNQRINELSAARIEIPDDFPLEMRDTPEETMRAEISSKLRNETNELSSNIAMIGVDISKHSKTIETLIATEIYQEQNQYETHQNLDSEEFLVDFPQINVTEEKIRETSEKSKIFVENRKSSPTKSISSACSNVLLTKSEILALLKVHWTEAELVKFHDLISPENYTILDAACAFHCCLELHTEKSVVLRQSECFEPILIEQYPCYSSESD